MRKGFFYPKIKQLFKGEFKRKKYVFFPIEILDREIVYRLYSAVELANSMDDVVIVIAPLHMTNKLVKLFHDSLYVGKHIFQTEYPYDKSLYHRIKSRNFRYIYHDEEGAVYPKINDDHFNDTLFRRLNPDSLQENDLMFLWGEHQKETYLKKKPGLQSIIHVTGHPRFDINKKYSDLYLSYDISTEVIKDSNKSYILVCSSKPLPFSYDHLINYFNVSKYSSLSDESKIQKNKIISDNCLAEIDLINCTIELAKRYTSETIVFRLHPVCNDQIIKIYKLIFKSVKNIVINYSTPSDVVICNSKILLHSGCTTSIQAYLMNIPIINIHSDNISYTVASNLGFRANNKNDIFTLVDDVINNRESGACQNPADDDIQMLLSLSEASNPDIYNQAICKSLSEIRLSIIYLRHLIERFIMFTRIRFMGLQISSSLFLRKIVSNNVDIDLFASKHLNIFTDWSCYVFNYFNSKRNKSCKMTKINRYCIIIKKK